MNKLKENIIQLEELSKTFEESIKNLKIIFENINQNKEDLKLKIQKIFTKIRNVLNDREDELLLKVDDYFINENIIRDGEKLPNKIKISLEKGKKINENFENNEQLCLLINDCLNIENNITEINNINQNLKKFNNYNFLNIKFSPQNNEDINKLLVEIQNFGKIFYDNLQFQKCPENINKDRTFMISGEIIIFLLKLEVMVIIQVLYAKEN